MSNGAEDLLGVGEAQTARANNISSLVIAKVWILCLEIATLMLILFRSCKKIQYICSIKKCHSTAMATQGTRATNTSNCTTEAARFWQSLRWWEVLLMVHHYHSYYTILTFIWHDSKLMPHRSPESSFPRNEPTLPCPQRLRWATYWGWVAIAQGRKVLDAATALKYLGQLESGSRNIVNLFNHQTQKNCSQSFQPFPCLSILSPINSRTRTGARKILKESLGNGLSHVTNHSKRLNSQNSNVSWSILTYSNCFASPVFQQYKGTSWKWVMKQLRV